MPKYFEDLEVGQTFQSPRDRLMTRQEIIEFAREWDPQLYHIDDAAARRSPIGRLFASALHSLAVGQKLAHESGVFEVLPIVGLGINDLSFPKPVIEGDRVRGRAIVQEKRLSRSRPNEGIVTIRIELINQNDEVVLSYSLKELVHSRPKG